MINGDGTAGRKIQTGEIVCKFKQETALSAVSAFKRGLDALAAGRKHSLQRDDEGQAQKWRHVVVRLAPARD